MNKEKRKQIVYVDMDNVLVDFPSGIARLSESDRASYEDSYDDCPGIFALMDPMPGAIDGYKFLAERFDTYILSTAPWNNPSAWLHKVEWVHQHLGDVAYKRLILSHHKNLNHGDYLIDDRTKNGADKFIGKHIHFGQPECPDWNTLIDYFDRLLRVSLG